MSWLIENHNKAAMILNFILEHMDRKNALCCSYQIFEDKFGYSKSTVQRALKVLKENGYIAVLKVGSANVYIVNPQFAWSSWNNQKEYCKFDGNILISRKENVDYELKQKFSRIKHIENE
jgi:DNA-binding transcriptional ArsR family regulator